MMGGYINEPFRSHRRTSNPIFAKGFRVIADCGDRALRMDRVEGIRIHCTVRLCGSESVRVVTTRHLAMAFESDGYVGRSKKRDFVVSESEKLSGLGYIARGVHVFGDTDSRRWARSLGKAQR